MTNPAQKAETAFTPGPWKLMLNTLRYRIVTDDAEETEILTWDAISPTLRTAAAEEKANARLLAAAPDLYTALKAVLGNACLHPDDYDGAATDAIASARAAIAQAEGRP